MVFAWIILNPFWRVDSFEPWPFSTLNRCLDDCRLPINFCVMECRREKIYSKCCINSEYDLKFKNWKIKILFLVSLIFVFLQNDLCGFASWASRCPAVHWQRIESFLNIPKSSVFERRATVIALIALPQGPCTRNWECWMRSSKTDARTPPKESINSRLFKRWVFFHVVAAYHL